MAIEAVGNCFYNVDMALGSALSSVCSTISSIPGAVQRQLDECCSTDCKVYGLIVLGRMLQAAAILGVATCIFGAVMTGPFVLFGIIPAIATALLGTYMAACPDDVHDAIFPLPPYVPGQPVGLINSGNNCWANASMQLLLNSPTLLANPAAQRIPQVQQIAQAYAATQNIQDRVVRSADGQLIRNVLHGAGRVHADSVQEDAAEFFEYLFEVPHSLYHLQETVQGVARHQTTDLPLIPLALEQNISTPFNTLFNSFFNFQDDAGQAHALRFASAPDDLLVQLRRFYTPLRDGRPIVIDAQGHYQEARHNQAIAVPQNTTLEARHCQDGQAANYECDGFIVQFGNTINSGHYVAFVKRPDNTWWACNDRRVRQITPEYAQQLMNQGYIYHYRKVPTTT
ncbi:MAG: ubiquitin carboxyl-terminal hydrolase [Verrucomicrobia bacterium]|nr:ubiquitin carboxyl-terminal hydrolase [Verrucomicrobiota bacterium]